MIRRFSDRRSPQLSARLSLEEFEGRIVPATYRWAFATPTPDWNIAANWQKESGGAWGLAPEAPGETDTALFNGTNTGNVNVNVASVGNVEITSAYTGTLSISGGSVIIKLLTMNGGTIKAGGNNVVTALLPYAGNTITAGTFDKVALVVGSNNAMVAPSGATLTIDGDMALKNGAFIQVSSKQTDTSNPNELNWQSGSIFTPATGTGAASDSQIRNYSATRINSNGTLGNAADASTERLLNAANATLTVYSTPTVAGSFTNAGSLSVRRGANLSIQGTAVQSSGTTELRRGGIITMPATGVYAVNAGSLIGSGTIDGNLTLSTPTGGAATISPGTADAEIGTLTITKSLHMQSASVSTNIQVFANGTFDRILVQNGYAILNGNLTVNVAVGYTPMAASHTFLSASTFIAPNTTTPTDFSSGGITGQTDPWASNDPKFLLRWKLNHDNSNYWVYVDNV